MPAVDLFEWLRMPTSANRDRSRRLERALPEQVALLGQPDLERWRVLRDWIGEHNVRMDLVSDNPSEFTKPVSTLDAHASERIQKILNLDAWIEAKRLDAFFAEARSPEGQLPYDYIHEWNETQRLKQMLQCQQLGWATNRAFCDTLSIRVLRAVHHGACTCEGRSGLFYHNHLQRWDRERYRHYEKWLLIRALWLRLYNEKITHYEGKNVFDTTDV